MNDKKVHGTTTHNEVERDENFREQLLQYEVSSRGREEVCCLCLLHWLIIFFYFLLFQHDIIILSVDVITFNIIAKP